MATPSDKSAQAAIPKSGGLTGLLGKLRRVTPAEAAASEAKPEKPVAVTEAKPVAATGGTPILGATPVATGTPGDDDGSVDIDVTSFEKLSTARSGKPKIDLKTLSKELQKKVGALVLLRESPSSELVPEYELLIPVAHSKIKGENTPGLSPQLLKEKMAAAVKEEADQMLQEMGVVDIWIIDERSFIENKPLDRTKQRLRESMLESLVVVDGNWNVPLDTMKQIAGDKAEKPDRLREYLRGITNIKGMGLVRTQKGYILTGIPVKASRDLLLTADQKANGSAIKNTIDIDYVVRLTLDAKQLEALNAAATQKPAAPEKSEKPAEQAPPAAQTAAAPAAKEEDPYSLEKASSFNLDVPPAAAPTAAPAQTGDVIPLEGDGALAAPQQTTAAAPDNNGGSKIVIDNRPRIGAKLSDAAPTLPVTPVLTAQPAHIAQAAPAAASNAPADTPKPHAGNVKGGETKYGYRYDGKLDTDLVLSLVRNKLNDIIGISGKREDIDIGLLADKKTVKIEILDKPELHEAMKIFAENNAEYFPKEKRNGALALAPSSTARLIMSEAALKEWAPLKQTKPSTLDFTRKIAEQLDVPSSSLSIGKLRDDKTDPPTFSYVIDGVDVSKAPPSAQVIKKFHTTIPLDVTLDIVGIERPAQSASPGR